jgi:hypothetical protein
MAETGTLIVENLGGLTRAFKAAEGDLDKLLRKELKAIGAVVQQQAKRNAAAEGLRDTGALISGIKVGYSRGSVNVYSSAARRSSVSRRTFTKTKRNARVAMGFGGGANIVNYPYPNRYEFEGRGSGPLGPRAFMYPALEQKREQIVGMFDDVLEKLSRDFGRQL